MQIQPKVYHFIVIIAAVVIFVTELISGELTGGE